MKRILVGAVSAVLVSGVAISAAPESFDAPDSRTSLMEYSDYRDNTGEARAFWQYSFGHAKSEVNGLRYGLRYDGGQPFQFQQQWRAPMLEFAVNRRNEFMPYELNLSGMNILDRNYMLHADGEGINWTTWGTVGIVAGATAYAVSSEGDGDDVPTKSSGTADGGADDGGGVLDLTDLSDLSDVVDLSDVLPFDSWSAVTGGNGYIPAEPLAPHEVEALRKAAAAD